ncbi:MAG: phosphatase PAP2 family protein [Acidimicrobiia bacterium]|nr:phosphatase PAP2 family protein [Acidimicrobiia bacterium]
MALCAVVFVVLAVAVFHVRGPIGVDRAIGGPRGGPSTTNPLEQLLPAAWAWARWSRYRRLAWLGSPQFVFTIVALLVVVAIVRRDRTLALVTVVGPAAVALLGWLLKRPIDRLIGATQSYPSGHATLAGALAALIVLVAYRLGGARAALLAALPAAVMPGLASIALVRLGWHYPTDVAGGLAFGIGGVCAVALATTTRGVAGRTRPAPRRSAAQH